MDLNLVVLCGKISADPEFREFPSGARYLRFQVTTRCEEPRKRTDVIPVKLWDPPPDLVADPPRCGQRVYVTAALNRKFWGDPDDRRSRLEVVANQLTIRPTDDTADPT